MILKQKQAHSFSFSLELSGEFSDNNLLILTSTAKDLANFKKNLIDDLIKKEEENLKNTNISDKDKYISSYKIQTLKEINQ